MILAADRLLMYDGEQLRVRGDEGVAAIARSALTLYERAQLDQIVGGRYRNKEPASGGEHPETLSRIATCMQRHDE